MLIRLRLENLYSFKAAEFSMIASPERIHRHHIYPAQNRQDIRLTRFAALYGANAAGKSNLVKALRFAQTWVLQGLRPEAKIPVEPFRLDPAYAGRPSCFAIEIKCQGKLYEYGFECDRNQVYREWLQTFNRTTEQLLFERRTQPDGKTQITLGEFSPAKTAEDRQFLEFVAKGTRPNQLYLHECIERNVDGFVAPYNWFRHSLTIIDPSTHPLYIEVELAENENFQDFFNQILAAADTGIARLATVHVDWDSPEGRLVQQVLADMPHPDSADVMYLHNPAGMRFTVVNPGDQAPELLKLVTIHRTSDGQEVTFDIYEESDGTQRLIDLIPLLHELTASEEIERVFVVDELGRSLHPQLSQLLVELHLNSHREQSSLPASQLITTTHETKLLSLELLRRDEVWFAEKQPDGATDLYSLYDFQPRYDKSILQDYLQGRYGAIPFLGSARALGLKPLPAQ